eukprot:15052702-Ditylum_brightwellii.AAC.1
MNISGAAVGALSSLGGGGDIFIPTSMTVDKDKNDNVDDKSKESDCEDSVIVMSENSAGADINEKEKSDAASIFLQINSDIVKKYENACIEISDCMFLENKYSKGLDKAKKGKSTKDASVPEVKAGTNKVDKSLSAQKVMKYAEKYNEAMLLMEDAVKHKSESNGR